MLNKLLSMVRRYDMLRPGDTVICAVSGGADSVALLYALYLLREKLQIRLEAAHFNHCLRGSESQRDEAFVIDLCRRCDIPLHLGRHPVAAGDKGLEAAAREARYAFFDTLTGKIATAHTADDNAETVLMHMVRGTGLKGLGGITPVRDRLVRPMLLVTRRDVLEFLREYHIPWVEDSSNQTDAFLRNRLRHHVMPLLVQENPRLSENLSAMALRLRLDEEALSELPDFSEGLAVEPLRSLPPARVSRILAAFLEHCGIQEPEARHIELARNLVFSQDPSARGYFPGGILLGRCYGSLRRLPETTELAPVTISPSGVTLIPQLSLQVTCCPADTLENNEHTFTFYPQGTIVLRPRQSGDTIRLSGGSRSLKKLFIDRKIPAAQRGLIPVLSDSAGILGIYGIGADERRKAAGLPALTLRIAPCPPAMCDKYRNA